ncbi:MAG: superoxide dismutase [Ni] [Desulforhopalus sp.]
MKRIIFALLFVLSLPTFHPSNVGAHCEIPCGIYDDALRMNKDKHAEMLQEIVWQYFMTQRIKLDAPDYDKKLASLHQMLVYSMKCKQTTDLANVEKLRAATEDFHKLYFEH